jgi:hypothetical protein
MASCFFFKNYWAFLMFYENDEDMMKSWNTVEKYLYTIRLSTKYCWVFNEISTCTDDNIQ